MNVVFHFCTQVLHTVTLKLFRSFSSPPLFHFYRTGFCFCVHWCIYRIALLLKVPYLCTPPPPSPSPLHPPLLSGVLFMSQPAGLWMSLPPFYVQLLQNSLDCEGQSAHRWKGGKAPISPLLFPPALQPLHMDVCFLKAGCVAFSRGGEWWLGQKSIWIT